MQELISLILNGLRNAFLDVAYRDWGKAKKAQGWTRQYLWTKIFFVDFLLSWILLSILIPRPMTPLTRLLLIVGCILVTYQLIRLAVLAYMENLPLTFYKDSCASWHLENSVIKGGSKENNFTSRCGVEMRYTKHASIQSARKNNGMICEKCLIADWRDRWQFLGLQRFIF